MPDHAVAALLVSDRPDLAPLKRKFEMEIVLPTSDFLVASAKPGGDQ